MAEPKDVKKCGITQRTLYNVNSTTAGGKWGAISLRTVQRLVAIVYGYQ